MTNRLNLRRVRKRVDDKRAISVAISSVILTAAVIAVSFVVLFWAQYRSSAYNEQYSEAMNSDIAKLKERLTFEYIFYNSSESNLIVYLMNWGRIDNVTVQTVFVGNTTWFTTFSNIDLKFLNGTSAQGLDMREEGYFLLHLPNLVVRKSYTVRVITGRGSVFESTFVA